MSKKKKGLAKEKAQRKQAERVTKVNARIKEIEKINFGDVDSELINYNDRQIMYFKRNNFKRKVKK